MNATTKKLVISALVLGLSSGVYAQTAGGAMGAGANGSTSNGPTAGGKGGGVSSGGTGNMGMGGMPDNTTGTGAKSGMSNDVNNGLSQDQGTVQRSAPNSGGMNMDSNGMNSHGSGLKKPY